MVSSLYMIIVTCKSTELFFFCNFLLFLMGDYLELCIFLIGFRYLPKKVP